MLSRNEVLLSELGANTAGPASWTVSVTFALSVSSIWKMIASVFVVRRAILASCGGCKVAKGQTRFTLRLRSEPGAFLGKGGKHDYAYRTDRAKYKTNRDNATILHVAAQAFQLLAQTLVLITQARHVACIHLGHLAHL